MGTFFESKNATREAAGKEAEAIYTGNKNSKKVFSEFDNILHNYTFVYTCENI